MNDRAAQSDVPRSPGGASAGTDLRIVLTTVTAGTPAEALARALVDERLAACVNVLPPMVSIYRWRDRVERDSEQQLVIKTTSGRLPDVRARMAALHPYELPELIVLPVVDGDPAYLDWVRAQTTATDEPR